MATDSRPKPSPRLEHIDSTTGSPDALWACWADVSTWSDWAGWVVSASLDGPFEPGSSVTVVERYGRRTTFLVTAVDPGRSNELQSKVPGAVVHMRREILSTTPRTTFKHSVWLEGPLATVWRGPLRARARDTLPQSMRRLAIRAGAVHR
ncbi:MAG: hypothetical protein WA966_16660 [Ornithinimicrobium sp.]